MKYTNIKKGRFINRPNRFIANVEINGKIESVHVKNTGRCRELLVEGAEVYLEKSNNPNRKTKYDIIAVMKKDRLINMDSQVPNKVVFDWVNNSNYFENITKSKREVTFGNSRFDIYVEYKNKKAFLEVKGVTLEENGVVKFPDAPTERGVKHIKELIEARKQGYEAFIFFLIQMEDVKYFTPNIDTQRAFKEALEEAEKNGVKILVYDSIVRTDEIYVNKPVKYYLNEEKMEG